MSVQASHDVVGVTEKLTHILTVKNLSDVAATGVVITYELPVNLILDSTPAGCGIETKLLSCRLDRIPGGASQAITVHKEAVEEGAVNSRIYVSAYQHDPEPTNNEVILNATIEEAPPPRISFEPLGDGSGTITLHPHDPLSLVFNIENWPLSGDGSHAHWLLNGVKKGELYSNSAINLSGLEEKKHTATVELVGNDHSAIGIEKSVTFTIKRAPWPTVKIETPVNGKEYSADSTIQLRYRLDYAGVAQSETDFMLIINDILHTHLSDPQSMTLDDLGPGHHIIKIQYVDSQQADAVVTFRIDEDENTDDVNVVDPPPPNSPTSSGGGGLGVFMVLLILLWHCFVYNYSRRLHG